MQIYILRVLPATCLLHIACGWPPAAAQQSLSIKQSVEKALTTHPALVSRAQKASALASLVQQARLRPSPILVAQSEDWNPKIPTAFGPTHNDQFLYISQWIETAGKRQRRVELAESAQRLSSLDRDLLERQIAFRVRQAYWGALGAQQVVILLEETLANFRQTIEYHENQVREGALAEADLIRVRIESDRVQLAFQAALLEAERARINLFQEMGQSEFAPVVLTETPEIPLEPVIVDLDRALASRLEIRMARQAVEQARAGLRLQQALARPDVEVLAGYKRNAGFNTGMFGFQFALPIQNRNQGNIASAASEIKVEAATLSATEALVRAEVLAAQADVESKRKQLSDFLAGTLMRTEESLRIARAAYREGGTDLLRLLDAERISIELRVLNARTQVEYRQSLVALEAAMGVTQ